jgi:hypothetical protein
MHRCLFVSKIEALRVCLEGEVSPWLAKPSTISIRLVHHRNGTQCIDSLDTKHTIRIGPSEGPIPPSTMKVMYKTIPLLIYFCATF